MFSSLLSVSLSVCREDVELHLSMDSESSLSSTFTSSKSSAADGLAADGSFRGILMSIWSSWCSTSFILIISLLGVWLRVSS